MREHFERRINYPFTERLTLEEVGLYMDCNPGSLSVGRCRKHYDLRAERHGRRNYYERAQIDRLMGDGQTGPMLNRKNAARYIGRSPLTLKDPDWSKRNNLMPARLRRAVRYRIAALDKFRMEQIKPS